MVTKERNEALQWFSGRGEVYKWAFITQSRVSASILELDGMVKDGHVAASRDRDGYYHITDKGRRDLHDE